MSAKKLYRLDTRKEIVPKAPSARSPVQYPRTWFQSNHPSKPTLSLILEAVSLSNIRGKLAREIARSNLKINTVKTFGIWGGAMTPNTSSLWQQ